MALVLNWKSNRIIEIVARVVAANPGAKADQVGASIQIANMVSARLKEMLGNLQNDKGEQLRVDTVEDPKLFRALLMDPQAIARSKPIRRELALFFTGTVTAAFAIEGSR